MNLSHLSKQQKIELIALLEEKKRREEMNQLKRQYQKMYDWQKRFISATKSNRSCMLMAANRCVSGFTNLDYISSSGMDRQSRPFLEALHDLGAGVVSSVDGSEHISSKLSAYFQGIQPATRLYLEDGAFLDCSDEHQVLASEGCYSTISQLKSQQGAFYSLNTLLDCLASCDEGDYQYGQLLHLLLNIDQSHTQQSCDALQHILDASPEDEAVQTGLYIQALQGVDLLSNPDGLSLSAGLFGQMIFQFEQPCAELMSCLQKAFQLLNLESCQIQQAVERHFDKTGGYGEVCSTDIFVSFQGVLLYGGKRIIAYKDIGLQPLFDLQVMDANNYSTSGVINHNCGKTMTGLTMDAYHLTGEYPDDWEGHRFIHAPRCWLLGFSMEKTRDLLQMPLFGRMEGGQFLGGLIHKDKILGHFAAQGTSGAMREIRVAHKSGGESVCQFWSYSQGQHAIMGDSVDWYHIDEEPKDKTIYPQVLTRTATGDKGAGGRGILTFTPENGRTELVVQFMDSPAIGQHMQRATWDDAKHLTEETKEQLLASFPEWQRDMRTKGLPLLGTGLIFDIKIPTCKAFPCPDHWYVINGMDFGWDHPQAHCQLIWDKDDDIIYVSKIFRKSKTQPYEVWHSIKGWARNVPTAWPADGYQTEKGSGKSQKSYYEESGWLMLPKHAQWPDGGNSVEQGLMELYDRFKTGKLVVFDHLTDLIDELMQYHRDENGKVVKVADDAIDCVRYAYMMRRYAETKHDILNQPEYHEERHHQAKTGSLGY